VAAFSARYHPTECALVLSLFLELPGFGGNDGGARRGSGSHDDLSMGAGLRVPLIGAGQSEDKPEICARIEWLGVGIDLKTDKPAPKQIRAAVGKILADRGYQNRVRDFQRTMSEYDAPAIAATLLEQLT
jgi:hypothetical protein